MRSRITGFIIFIVFLMVFMTGAQISKDILFTRYEVTEINENDVFIDNVKVLLEQIKIIRAKRKEFAETARREEPVNISVFYIMVSPRKEAGLFYNGAEWLVHEGDLVGSRIRIEEIRSDGIIVKQGERSYFVSK
ncbi:MAG TPA: hypothetical protein PLF44_04405 [Candidatus Mcinerneyibacteriales bacterium]|nr:hypothetical protein [Candidatus Mcinerneyibacteriales bacterium]HPJ70102.1 hypothetical protein [Candidatus Mcinerneyibacteriales bacterium]HPQ89461.1 hypothetical protein [Candidatus Mcinerneyibacteriales bacterium]